MKRTEGVRLTKTCKGRYWSATWLDSAGGRRWKNLGATDTMSKTAANGAMQRLIADQAITPALREVRGDLTVREWCAEYLKLRAELSAGTRTLAEWTISTLNERLGGRRLRDITPAMAADWKRWLGTRTNPRRKDAQGDPLPIAPATVHLHLRCVRTIWATAVRHREAVENPFRLVDAPTLVVSEDWEEITREQLEKLLSVLPDHAWKCLIALCRLAGMRLGWRGGEALNLTWDDVDWQERLLRVTDQKTSRLRTTPNEPPQYEILREAWEAAPDGATLVCPVHRNNLDRNARALVKKAGLPAYAKPFHTLRKNLENEWLDRHPLPIVCKWLGNSPTVAMRHYHKRESRNAMGRVTGQTESPEQAKIRALEAELAKLREGATA